MGYVIWVMGYGQASKENSIWFTGYKVTFCFAICQIWLMVNGYETHNTLCGLRQKRYPYKIHIRVSRNQ